MFDVLLLIGLKEQMDLPSAIIGMFNQRIRGQPNVLESFTWGSRIPKWLDKKFQKIRNDLELYPNNQKYFFKDRTKQGHWNQGGRG